METGHLIMKKDSLRDFPFGMSIMMDLSTQMRYIIKTQDSFEHQHSGRVDFKDVRANCFCAPLLRTQIHMPRHA